MNVFWSMHSKKEKNFFFYVDVQKKKIPLLSDTDWDGWPSKQKG